MDKALEHISEQPRLQGFKEYIKLIKHDVSTISCTISHAFWAAQGTVGLMPMLRGHNQLPELLFPLARMTFCGFAKGCCTLDRWWPYYCLGLSVNKQLDYIFLFLGMQQNKFSRLELLSCSRFPPNLATRGNISCRARKSLGGSRPSNIRRYASSPHDTHLRSYAMEKSSKKLGQKTPLFQHGKSPWALIMMSS